MCKCNTSQRRCYMCVMLLYQYWYWFSFKVDSYGGGLWFAHLPLSLTVRTSWRHVKGEGVTIPRVLATWHPDSHEMARFETPCQVVSLFVTAAAVAVILILFLNAEVRHRNQEKDVVKEAAMVEDEVSTRGSINFYNNLLNRVANQFRSFDSIQSWFIWTLYNHQKVKWWGRGQGPPTQGQEERGLRLLQPIWDPGWIWWCWDSRPFYPRLPEGGGWSITISNFLFSKWSQNKKHKGQDKKIGRTFTSNFP